MNYNLGFVLSICIITIILFSGCISEKNIDYNQESSNTLNDLNENEIKEINPCDLISKDFAQTLLKENIKDSIIENRVAPEGKSCAYMTNKMIDNRKIELTIYQNNIVANEGIFTNVEKYFDNLKNAKVNASNLKITELNYGNKSYFDGFDLHILKEENYIIISISAEKQTANSSEEMESKLAESRLNFEKIVAEEVLKSLK